MFSFFLSLTLGIPLTLAIVANLWLRLAFSRIFGNLGSWLFQAFLTWNSCDLFHGKVLIYACVLSVLYLTFPVPDGTFSEPTPSVGFFLTPARGVPAGHTAGNPAGGHSHTLM